MFDMNKHKFDSSRHSSALLSRVTAGWQRLHDDERRGVVTAARIAADLAALNAPPALLALAAHVVRDEVHHLQVCARVLDELEPGTHTIPTLEVALGRLEASAPSESELARTLVTEFALGKPVTAAAFAAARALVREPLFAWAYTELLHDETRHATFGAKAAAWVIRNWSQQQRQALWTECLTSTIEGGCRVRDDEAEALGLLPGEVECTLPRWILPHLAPLGVKTSPSSNEQLLH